MNSTREHITKNSAIKFLSYTFIFDTVIAIFLTAIKFGAGFPINFIISQCIGLSICTCVFIAHCFFDNAGPILKAILVAVALTTGSICGSYLGSFVSGMSPSTLFERHSLFQLLFLGVMFGAIITYFFSSREQIAESKAQIQEEKIKRLTSEKKAAEVNLKLLQAQIEPHFLFNTLSNVLSLLDTDSEKGKSMLMDFVRYLRTSLSKIREDTTTLGQEIEMIRAYLKIFKVRMGDRLRYNIDIPISMANLPFPPIADPAPGRKCHQTRVGAQDRRRANLNCRGREKWHDSHRSGRYRPGFQTRASFGHGAFQYPGAVGIIVR